MAESYATQGRQCDVATYAGKPLSWERWCDCMYTNIVTETAYFVNGVSSHILALAFPGASPLQLAQKMVQMSGGLASIETRQVQRKMYAPEWRKCISKFCASPVGCGNNYTSGNDPFNVHPGAASAPWTEVGAVARGIPHSNPTVLTTLAQLTSIDTSEYEPLNLWRTYWTNLGKYLILAGKAALIPGLGAPIVAAMAQPLTLAPLALAQAVTQRKDLVFYIVKPALTGSLDQLSFVGKLIGPALGLQWASVAGVMAQKFSKDQIATGELARIPDPTTQGVIVFLSESGEELGRLIQDVITSVGSNVNTGTIPGVFSLLKRVFTTMSNRPEFTPEARGTFQLIADAMGVGEAISEGAAKNETPLQISDRIFFSLFGLRFAEIQKALAVSQDELKKLLQQARGPTSIDSALARIDAIGTTITTIVNRLTDIASKIGGGVDRLAQSFAQAGQMFAGLQTDARSAIFAAKQATGATPASIMIQQPRSRLAARVATRTVVPAVQIVPPPVSKIPPMRVINVQPATSAPTPTSTQAKGGAGPIVGGIVAGALVAGPVGALVGAVAGALLGRGAPKTSLAGYGGPLALEIGPPPTDPTIPVRIELRQMTQRSIMPPISTTTVAAAAAVVSEPKPIEQTRRTIATVEPSRTVDAEYVEESGTDAPIKMARVPSSMNRPPTVTPTVVRDESGLPVPTTGMSMFAMILGAGAAGFIAWKAFGDKS